MSAAAASGEAKRDANTGDLNDSAGTSAGTGIGQREEARARQVIRPALCTESGARAPDEVHVEGEQAEQRDEEDEGEHAEQHQLELTERAHAALHTQYLLDVCRIQRESCAAGEGGEGGRGAPARERRTSREW